MKSALHLLLYFLWMCPVAMYGQTQSWQWAKGATGNLIEAGGHQIAADNEGNLYVSGYYRGSIINFDSISLGDSGFGVNLFLTKYKPNGNVAWAKKIGGPGHFNVGDVAADNSGNVYLTGTFLADSIVFDTMVITNPGMKRKMFLVKYDSTGLPLWAITAGGSQNSDDEDAGFGIATDAQGGVFISGRLNSDTMTFGNISLVKSGIWDMYLAKFDASGNVLWAKRVGNTGTISYNRIATDATGNLLISGWIDDVSVMFDTIQISSPGGTISFVAKYNGNGEVQWVRTMHGNDGGGTLYGITSDLAGNVVAAGHFMGDSIKVGNIVLTNFGGNCFSGFSCFDIYLVKFDPDGNLLWAKSEGGDVYDMVYSVATDSIGNIYLTGGFSSSTLQLGNFQLTSAGTHPNATSIFLSIYNPSGSVLWAGKPTSVAPYGTDLGTGITCTGNGEVYITGEFSSPSVDFGNATVAKSGLLRCYFLAKLSVSLLTGADMGILRTNGFQMFPNPTTGIFTVAADGPNTGNFEVKVFSILGQEVITINKEGSEVLVDLSTLASGTYIVRVTDGLSVGVHKVLVQR